MGVSSFWWHNRYHWHEPWIITCSCIHQCDVTKLRMSHFCSLVSKDALLGIECFEFWKFWYIFIVHKVLLCHKIKQNSIRHDNRTQQNTDGQKHSTKIQPSIVGGYHFCFDFACTQASSPNRGYQGWSHTMTSPLRGLRVRSTDLHLETVKSAWDMWMWYTTEVLSWHELCANIYLKHVCH